MVLGVFAATVSGDVLRFGNIRGGLVFGGVLRFGNICGVVSGCIAFLTIMIGGVVRGLGGLTGVAAAGGLVGILISVSVAVLV